MWRKKELQAAATMDKYVTAAPRDSSGACPSGVPKTPSSRGRRSCNPNQPSSGSPGLDRDDPGSGSKLHPYNLRNSPGYKLSPLM